MGRPPLPEDVAGVGLRQEPNLERIAEVKPDVILVSDDQLAFVPALERIAPVLHFETFSAGHDNAEAARRIFLELASLFRRENVAERRLAERETQLESASTLCDQPASSRARAWRTGMEPTETDRGVDPPSDVEPLVAPSTTSDLAESSSGEATAAVPDEAAGPVSGGVADLLGPVGEFLDKGGIAIWAIAALSVATLAIIIWKLWRYGRAGVWRRARAELAVDCWQSWRDAEALDIAISGRGVRARLAATAIRSTGTAGWTDDDAREETARVARKLLADARAGLRPLELIATIAPLLGLLGTVLGMITAFQQLQAAGSRADPSALAGGIWEALLTTAAGMAVAIPASTALTWFESVNDGLRHDLEDIATRIFNRPCRAAMKHAAE